MAVKIALMGQPRSLHTLFARLGAGYHLKGFVPWASHGKVSFGACKKEDAARGTAWRLHYVESLARELAVHGEFSYGCR